jgi:hypothetical protein
MQEEKDKRERKISLPKYLIIGSIFAYLIGVTLSFLSWKFIQCKYDNSKWNWEIIYGPGITVVSYWIFGSMIFLFIYVRNKNKA